MDPMLAFVVKLLLISQIIIGVTNANVVFNVQHKFGGRVGGGRNSTALGRSILTSLKTHDDHRHGRMLAAVDFQLGGDGLPTGTGLYYTKLSIGTPPKDYFVQVDTGSDNLWLNCAECSTCPKRTDLGFNITWYDLKSSSTGTTISCDEDFCSSAVRYRDSPCKVGGECEFSVAYGDGSKTSGYYVRDRFKFDKILGEFQTSSMEGGNIAFGCSTKQYGDSSSSSSKAVDGIVGFGQGSTSILSQLAFHGKTKRIFSHCLDSVQGGGIFAIGEVEEPKVHTTPMVHGKPHYNAYLERIEVGGFAVWHDQNELAKGGMPNTIPEKTGAIIDSGTTLAFLPDKVFDAMMFKIMEKHHGLKTYTLDTDFTCFRYSNNIDDDFPVVSFHFENSAALNTYPHDYLFNTVKDEYCIGLLRTQHVINGKQITLLGDVVLADKLIVYDLEKMTIGWTEYNCSSSIKVKDESSGDFYSVVSDDIIHSNSEGILCKGKGFILFVSFVMMLYLIE